MAPPHTPFPESGWPHLFSWRREDPAAADPGDSSFLPFTAKTHTHPPDSACCELTPAYMVLPALLHLASLCPGRPGVAERVRLILLCTPRTGTGLLSEKHLEE